jgi:regulatory LuxR family protein
VQLVAEGIRNQEISLKLNVTEHTVRNYLSHIFDKLGMAQCALEPQTATVSNLRPVRDGTTRRKLLPTRAKHPLGTGRPGRVSRHSGSGGYS